eukprot:4387545-Amphidinium_carterae.1
MVASLGGGGMGCTAHNTNMSTDKILPSKHTVYTVLHVVSWRVWLLRVTVGTSDAPPDVGSIT